MTGNPTDLIAARITGERWVTKSTGDRGHLTHREISRLAYHFYEVRGRQEGGDIADWLLAERELTHHYGSLHAPDPSRDARPSARASGYAPSAQSDGGGLETR